MGKVAATTVARPTITENSKGKEHAINGVEKVILNNEGAVLSTMCGGVWGSEDAVKPRTETNPDIFHCNSEDYNSSLVSILLKAYFCVRALNALAKYDSVTF